MARVVSVTSIAVQRDSRTFKFAASVARLGHESVVVEGEPSTMLDRELPFKLISPENAPEPPAFGAPEGEADDAAPTEPAPLPLVGSLARKLPTAAINPLRRVADAAISSFTLVRLYLRDIARRNRETRGLLPDADVYWLHGFWQFPAVYSKSRRAGARLLYDTPDAYWEPGQTPVEDRISRMFVRLYERIERYCARHAERFTTVSGGIAELLERRYGRRPEVVRNFHDLRLDEEADGDVRTASGVGPDDFLLVVVGNMKPEVTVKESLLALRDLPDRVHIAFVGRGHEVNRGLAEELGLSDRVHLLGHLVPTEIVSFIRTADAAPVLSRAATNNDLYSLPNKFFHAVAAGLPVLYPPLPEMSALGHEHELGVEIDPADPASIAAGIRTLSADPDAIARYRANVERARKVLNWEREEAVLADFLGAATPRPQYPHRFRLRRGGPNGPRSVEERMD